MKVDFLNEDEQEMSDGMQIIANDGQVVKEEEQATSEGKQLAKDEKQIDIPTTLAGFHEQIRRCRTGKKPEAWIRVLYWADKALELIQSKGGYTALEEADFHDYRVRMLLSLGQQNSAAEAAIRASELLREHIRSTSESDPADGL
ncbi:hypothetical protein LMH87_001678 [Akanthomyces muscarius]|uniref:Uncharacterized protein n=1 Tax=Akanthomyces muscarius TaxID=2231603 RepID=A0A9W8Q790_AKAMU|nr:hypothetical protein LMH87_001678 [Akanthomyces muscarius]KAJ4147131.1 hypothetical protein LMH87_001678 [Akanthomyces muscarius]